MSDKWTRDDLPTASEVLRSWDSAAGNGYPMLVSHTLNAVVDHINRNGSMPWIEASHSTARAMIEQRDAAVARAESAERERDASAERSVRQAETISNLREWLAEAELARDAALDCADLLERERDERMVRAENAEWGMGQPSTAWSNADLEAEVRRRTQCLRDNLNGVTRSRDEWKARAEAAENALDQLRVTYGNLHDRANKLSDMLAEARTAPAVSYEHLHQEVVAAYEYGRNPTERVEFIVKYMCALFGVEAEPADPVEDKARAEADRRYSGDPNHAFIEGALWATRHLNAQEAER